MYLCILGQDGENLLHKNIRSQPETFLEAIAPFRNDLVVAAECMFTTSKSPDNATPDNVLAGLGNQRSSEILLKAHSIAARFSSEGFLSPF